MANPGRNITDNDLYLLREGTHEQLYEIFGAHLVDDGTRFAVWAPRARSVAVSGSFNGWSREGIALTPGGSGVWQGFVKGVEHGALYKFRIETEAGEMLDKADPVAFLDEQPPGNASVVWNLGYEWGDQDWMDSRKNVNQLDAPMSIYEVHLGSWRRATDRLLNYTEMAAALVPYVKEMGFTHVEFLPVMEHPFYGSWGYQTTGYYAPTSRYGTPQDFMRLIDELHRNGIGVILDWVPSHFPSDPHGLGNFDGAHEYEESDPRRGIHPDWNSYIFDYGRGEVRSFLLSSALFWLKQYHADGLRLDAVASMLYLDYSRKAGEWLPNEYGGRENLNAIGFLRRLNEDVYRNHPDAQTIAEESTAYPMVSRPTYTGGLGFGFKWDMGWMHDTLQYLAQDPVYRKYHHQELIFRSVYAFNENFILPLSHDEVVYGKGSMLGKMPGDDWQKFASLRLLYGYMFAQPGKKLLFMGSEFGQRSEWSHEASLDWHLLDQPMHSSLRLLVGDLNHTYRSQGALQNAEYLAQSFEWIDAHDGERNVVSFLRKGREPRERVVVVCNFSPIPRTNYEVGVPEKGFWRELLNTDAKVYGGSGRGNFGGVETAPTPLHGQPHSITIELPPLATVYFLLQP